MTKIFYSYFVLNISLNLVLLFCIFLFNCDLSAQKGIASDGDFEIHLQHPYLLFSDADIPIMRERIEKTKEGREIMDALKMTTNRLLYTPVGSAPAQSKNPRYDGDGKYNNWIKQNREAMLELAFMYQITRDEKYAQKAFEFITALCEVPLWNYKAHEFPIIYDRVWPWNALAKDDQVVFNYDIRTGDIATEMGIAFDWLYTALSKSQRDKMRGAMLEKAILLARNNYDYHWWATSYKCNWNTICFTGLGISSLALLTEDSSLMDVVNETYKRTGLFLNELGNDGGWQEGRGYWAYGMRTNVFFIEAMKRFSNGEYNLFKHPKLQTHPVDFALYGLTGYFGDGSGKVVGSTYLINKLTEETKNTDAAWYRENMMQQGNSFFDIIWPKSNVKPIEPKIASRYFSSIDWAFMRTDFTNADNVTVACKAGFNDDPHHGHLDIGQFIVYWKDQYFITDLGRGEYSYDEKYFNEARWTYPPANSAGHNLIYVNDEQQISAKLKNKPWLEGIGGKIIDFRNSESLDYTLMDPTKAYPNKELQKWRRHLLLSKPDVVIVIDEVSCKPGSKIEARFHPGVEMEIADNITMLKGKNGESMAIIPIGNAKMEAGKHAYLPVRKDADMTWIPYVSSLFDSEKITSIIGHIILPVDNLSEALVIKKSLIMNTTKNGDLEIMLNYKSKKLPFFFETIKGELKLKK